MGEVTKYREGDEIQVTLSGTVKYTCDGFPTRIHVNHHEPVYIAGMTEK